MKVDLAAMNEKLDRNEKKMSEKVDSRGTEFGRKS